MQFGFTDYGARRSLDLMLNTAPWSAPQIWFGIAEADPGYAGSFLDESPLARVRIDTFLSSAILATGEVFLVTPFAMPNPTTPVPGFIATHGFVSDLATGGNMIFKARLGNLFNPLEDLVQVDGGFPIAFESFDISFQMDDHDDPTAFGLTNFGREALMNHACGKLFHTPGTRYLAIFRDDPGQAGTITSELSGSGYNRVAITTFMSLAASQDDQAVAFNDVEVVFPTATANWLDSAFLGIMNLPGPGTGNMIWRCPHRRVIAVKSGKAFKIPIGQLAFRLK